MLPDVPERSAHAQATQVVPPRAQAWLRQHRVSDEQLNHVFQIDGDLVELIAAAVPGRTDKERSLNVYILTGIARLLATGDSAFDDHFSGQRSVKIDVCDDLCAEFLFASRIASSTEIAGEAGGVD